MHHVQHEDSSLSPHLMHKYETPTKFWKSVEPYCAPITQDNISVSVSTQSVILRSLSSSCHRDSTGSCTLPDTCLYFQFLEQLLRGTDESERLLQIPPTLGKQQLQKYLEIEKREARGKVHEDSGEEKVAAVLGVSREKIESIRRWVTHPSPPPIH